MSDYELKRINALPEASAINDSDVFAIDSAAGTKKVAWETLKGEVDADITEAVSNKADADGTYPDMAVGSVLGTNAITDTDPYFLRPCASIGDREFDTLVGGSLGWNQLCNGSSVTVTSGHKYYMIKGGTKSVGASDGTALTGLTSGTDIVIDLTTLFGATIADYIYSLETATAGSGVAWVRKYLPNAYYAYCAPTLKHVSGVSAHVMTGFNQWDEVWEVGGINNTTGEPDTANNKIRSKNYCACFPSTAYYGKWGAKVDGSDLYAWFYDDNKAFISGTNIGNRAFTTPSNAHYFKTSTYGAGYVTYKNDICINLSDASKNGTYEPYESHTYPIDSTWTGMGVPKLDSDNRLYFDGDRYVSDGTVTERYRIVDLGTLNWTLLSESQTRQVYRAGLSDIKAVASTNEVPNMFSTKYSAVSINAPWIEGTMSINGTYSSDIVCVTGAQAYTDAQAFKTAMSGVYLVYEKATPTTSTASPFTSPQICDPNGTEEYVTTGLVPVGHETEYVENLADKLTDIPDLPTTAGNYHLAVTVDGGTPSYAWVADE